MSYFYFGNPDKDLFGMYSEPHPEKDRRKGILLCYPAGQEHIRAHRSFKQMTEQLCSIGFHVLRFDYFGTGDSLGDETECDTIRWRKDINDAINILQDYGDFDFVSVLGMRLGAALAMQVAEKNKDIENILLWDPVIVGESYLKEINTMHNKWVSDLLPKPPREAMTNNEVLGFSMTDKMIGSIKKIDLNNLQSTSLKTSHFLFSNTTQADNSIISLFKKRGISCTKEIIDSANVWKKGSNMESVLSSAKGLKAVVDYFVGVSK